MRLFYATELEIPVLTRAGVTRWVDILKTHVSATYLCTEGAASEVSDSMT